MKRTVSSIYSLAFAVLFTFLFYRQEVGLNLLLFEAAILAFYYLHKAEKLKNRLHLFFLGTVAITAINSVIFNSVIALSSNYLALMVLIGYHALPAARNAFTNVQTGLVRLLTTQSVFFENFSLPKGNTGKKTRWLRKAHLVLIPIAVVILFMIIYSQASPFFAKWTRLVTDDLFVFLRNFFQHLSFTMIAVGLLGIIVSNVILQPSEHPDLEKYDRESKFNLIRRRIVTQAKRTFKWDALLDKYRMGIMLFGSLNLVLLAMNVLDIKNVWFGFEWNGQFLKQFVHSGTYLLIVSIVISIWLTLSFFKGNINFLKKNKTLRWLAYVWLGQNLVLTLSVAIRNYWYIHYYALAYKRIGVFFFLVFVAFVLVLVFIKIHKLKTRHFLLHQATLGGFVILTIMGFFNWDVFISKYNIENADRSFVHFDFLARMSPKALPILDLSRDELHTIEQQQAPEFFDDRVKYMDGHQFYDIIQSRKNHFLENYEEKSWLSWNWAEHVAYKKLKTRQSDLR